MKTVLLLLIFVTLSCNSQKNKLVKNDVLEVKSNTNLTNKNQITNCPADGICSIEVLKNKSLIVKTDEIGALYYQIIDNKDTSVILYQYNKKTETGLQDASYREEIVFEMNNSETNISLSNLDLQKTKMLFGRHCFCKGQAGNFKVTEGNFKLVKNGLKIDLSLHFKVKSVPQIITSINAVF